MKHAPCGDEHIVISEELSCLTEASCTMGRGYGKNFWIVYEIILITAQTVHTSNGKVDRCAGVRNVDGIHLAGFVNASFVSGSLDNCFSTCRANRWCRSINYGYADRLCELNTETRTSKRSAVVPRRGMTYVENVLPGNVIIYIIFDGLARNTGRYFTSNE